MIYMDSEIQILNVVDSSVLAYIINKISGPGKSDKTIFYFEGGSVSRTSPPTPREFRGDKVFRELRHLPPIEGYSGKMIVNRQGGVPKSIEFK